MSEPDFITEPSRNILVYRRCDGLVVGGGPAGCAAAVSAARMGADVVLVERYGHLGGMSTGAFVLWIDRMTDCEGRQVVPGIANDILERIPDDDVLRPPPELWGSRDEDQVAYCQDRTNTFQGTGHMVAHGGPGDAEARLYGPHAGERREIASALLGCGHCDGWR
ncbi:MAG TPA: hypothetical protein DC056_11155 [Dehalococcoidia bacterium]|nr:hypothetical protein [Dehalococcoidia bacterium]